MAYLIDTGSGTPAGVPDMHNAAANHYALFRLHQQAALGQLSPEEVAAAKLDPTAWWRAYSAAVGGMIPQHNSFVPGVNTPQLTATGLAQAAAAGTHRFSPTITTAITPRQAVMNRLVRGAGNTAGY